jgi:hypothetical protein
VRHKMGRRQRREHCFQGVAPQGKALPNIAQRAKSRKGIALILGTENAKKLISAFIIIMIVNAEAIMIVSAEVEVCSISSSGR